MSTFQKSADEIRRAIIRELKAGVDVGELLVHAVCAAEDQVAAAAVAGTPMRGGRYGHVYSITANRPGSWEASLVDQIITAGGGGELKG